MRAPHPYDAVLKAQGRDCRRCSGYGWDTWWPGESDHAVTIQEAMHAWPGSMHQNCRDCGGTGRATRSPMVVEEFA